MRFSSLVFDGGNIKPLPAPKTPYRAFLGRLQPFLKFLHQPEALVPHDTRSVLARRHPAVRRYVLQVLRVHGSSRAGVADADNYIWLLNSDGQLWRGRLDRLAWKK